MVPPVIHSFARLSRKTRACITLDHALSFSPSLSLQKVILGPLDTSLEEEYHSIYHAIVWKEL